MLLQLNKLLENEWLSQMGFKTFSILSFDVENQQTVFNDEIAFVKAKTEIEALQKWYQHINAYYSHTSKYVTDFIYTAFADAKNNVEYGNK